MFEDKQSIVEILLIQFKFGFLISLVIKIRNKIIFEIFCNYNTMDAHWKSTKRAHVVFAQIIMELTFFGFIS